MATALGYGISFRCCAFPGTFIGGQLNRYKYQRMVQNTLKRFCLVLSPYVTLFGGSEDRIIWIGDRGDIGGRGSVSFSWNFQQLGTIIQIGSGQRGDRLEE